MASDRYLKDVTGKKDIIDFEKLIKDLGLKKLLPEIAQQYLEDLNKAEDDGVHQYLCHLDDLSKNRDCDTAKGIAQREKDRIIGIAQWDTNQSPELLYIKDGQLVRENLGSGRNKNKPLSIASGRFGKQLRSANTAATVNNLDKKNKPSGTFYTKSVVDDRSSKREQEDRKFENAVNGASGTSVGDRAVYFNPDGSIVRGAGNIRNNAIAIERSSNIPSESLSDGSIPENVQKKEPYKTSRHPSKKKVGATNDLAGGIAALGGITALVGLFALLMPMHLLTSAITFLTSIVTFFTNVNNVFNTYLTITDGVLNIFGIKGSGKKIKAFIASALDNAFGKENVKEAKNAFATSINSVAVATKQLEQIEQMRNSTDTKVDEARLAIGTINDALAAEGMIPPDFQNTSEGIKQFVDSTKDPDLKENIDKLTDELQDKEAANKQLKEEQESRDKAAKRLQDDANAINKLVDTVRTDVKGIDPSLL